MTQLDEQLSALRAQLAEEILARQRAEASSRESDERFHLMFEQAGTGIAQLAPDGAWLRVNQRLCDMLGYTREEFVQLTIHDITDPEYLQTCLDLHRRALAGEIESYSFKKYYRCKDGSPLWASVTGSLVRDGAGNPRYFNLVVADIGEQKRAEAALRETCDQLQPVLDAVPGGVLWIDDNLIYRGINRYFAQFFGIEPSYIIDKPLGFWGVSADFEMLVRRFFASTETSASTEVAAHHKGMDYVFLVMAQKYMNGRAAVFAGIDITERKQTEGQLLYDALHDRLTGVANRALFMDRLSHTTGIARRDSDRTCAVLFIDFDRFKTINDSMGHAAGDELLIEMAHRLGSCLRPGDTVARLGGDEFGILLDNIRDVGEAVEVADRLRHEAARPCNLRAESGNQHQVFVTISTGIAMYGPHYESPDQLLRDADIALYRAKARGRSCYEIFDSAMHDQAVRRLHLIADLRRALDRNELCLYYQPLISLGTKRIVGFEALVRWRHPERGLLMPGEFIPLAEEIGLMVRIDQWVLREACWQLGKWQQLRRDEGLEREPFRVSVNCSGLLFAHPDFCDNLEALVTETGVVPSGLLLETTENALIEHGEITAKTMEQLNFIGVRLCIDNFGTGYTALNHLHQLPIDMLKIDRSFLQRVESDVRSREILHAVVVLATKLAIDVVAEGIESEDQLARLSLFDGSGCQFGQGYFFSAPVTNEVASTLLRNFTELPAKT